MNTLGSCLRLTTFGESHGAAIGGVLDGMPAGVAVNYALVRDFMQRRRPGASPMVSARDEKDEVQILSGVNDEGVTLGTPIGFFIANGDCRSADYDTLKELYRPNHADYAWEMKYGIRDHRGGGRASARTTAPWVFAGAVAASMLAEYGIAAQASLITVGTATEPSDFEKEIAKARREGDSVGGVVECRITGVPPGLGEPQFGKLQARLAHAMMSINGVKGFEYGDGFEAARRRGSEHADEFAKDTATGRIATVTNHSGGIQGGISNGSEIIFRVAFKPTPSIARELQTVDRSGNTVTLSTHGRHDPCIALRGTVIVEALAYFVIADALLQNRLATFNNLR